MIRQDSIGILTKHNSYDRNSFSGTPYYMRKALEQRNQVRVLGGHRPPPSSIVRRLKKRLGFGMPPLMLTPQDQAGLDVILAPAATSEIVRFSQELTVPVVAITDATPAFIREYYKREVTSQDEEAEAVMLERADAVVYSSHFMALQALREFPHLKQDKVHVVPFGVNLDTLPQAPQEKPPLSEIHLLFIGQDWERKGGEIALATLDCLLKAGKKARLTLIGASSAGALAHPETQVLGYLDKNKPADLAKFSAALRDAHFLVFPTRADCTPMVIAEANAYACPVLVSETGGIGTLMKEGVNGHMLSLEDGPEAYADILMKIASDPAGYLNLSRSAFAHCKDRLTWSAWAAGMRAVIGDVLRCGSGDAKMGEKR